MVEHDRVVTASMPSLKSSVEQLEKEVNALRQQCITRNELNNVVGSLKTELENLCKRVKELETSHSSHEPSLPTSVMSTLARQQATCTNLTLLTKGLVLLDSVMSVPMTEEL